MTFTGILLTCLSILPLFLGVYGIWLAVTAAEVCACIVSIGFLAAKRSTYHY